MSAAAVMDSLRTSRCWMFSIPLKTVHWRPFRVMDTNLPLSLPSKTLPNTCRLPVGFLWFTEQFLADFSLFGCVKGGSVDIVFQCCFFRVYSGVRQRRCSAVVFSLHSDVVTWPFHFVYGLREGGSAFVVFLFCVKCFYRCCF